ncbi:hypothetical protein [Nonomuraea sp. NPDC048916]|uniref:hypothetical protein n=1 Tax=Nonomuraea sp. NPDC048916 TaxID=3154232 RepID=UPI003406F409
MTILRGGCRVESSAGCRVVAIRRLGAWGLTVRDMLVWLAAAVGAIGVIAFIARRTR